MFLKKSSVVLFTVAASLHSLAFGFPLAGNQDIFINNDAQTVPAVKPGELRVGQQAEYAHYGLRKRAPMLSRLQTQISQSKAAAKNEKDKQNDVVLSGSHNQKAAPPPAIDPRERIPDPLPDANKHVEEIWTRIEPQLRSKIEEQGYGSIAEKILARERRAIFKSIPDTQASLAEMRGNTPEALAKAARNVWVLREDRVTHWETEWVPSPA